MIISYLADSVNPDPSVYFSTAALLMGVLITVIGAALAQIILDVNQAADIAFRPKRRLRIIILASITCIDIWGVGYPFWALYQSALGHSSPRVVSLVFISTVIVALFNILLPYYLINLVRNARYWLNIFRVIIAGQKRGQEIRKLLTEEGYVDVEEYDKLVHAIKSGTLSHSNTVKLIELLSRALILASPRRISSPARTLTYYGFRPIIPLYARLYARQLVALMKETNSEEQLRQESSPDSSDSPSDGMNKPEIWLG